MENNTTMNEQLCLRIGNSLSELDRLLMQVECFLERCAVAGREAYHIQLALDELVTNVISYAFDAEGGHAIDVMLKRNPESVEMTLQDEGKPFNPLMAPEPDVNAAAQKRKIGGLGIHFVRKTMDELIYERKNGKNILHIRKKTT
jgi:anti-sigma regulatory factor (Ser/Thr protein kinase)